MGKLSALGSIEQRVYGRLILNSMSTQNQNWNILSPPDEGPLLPFPAKPSKNNTLFASKEIIHCDLLTFAQTIQSSRRKTFSLCSQSIRSSIIVSGQSCRILLPNSMKQVWLTPSYQMHLRTPEKATRYLKR